ncbi:MAG TPA: hypothetical protein VMC86_06400 [Gemmatimonadales bacterium]|nr:hypothetical protein [Gemmatimonadales bacterium]
MNPDVPTPLVRVEPESIAPAAARALRAGAVVANVPAGVFDLDGPGAVACMQGLLTSDLDAPGEGTLVYGALLTPKGMIVVDGWAGRRGHTVRFTVPAEGRERAAGIFRRSIPPRLARVTDRSTELRVLRLAGPGAIALAEAARLSVPGAPGRIGSAGDAEVGRASEAAPFALQWIGPAGAVEDIRKRLLDSGVVAGDAAVLELARILAGWPGLASEIDDKTLPQEVRYDEIGGVSYTKGCYTGQETVSRLHFRGHPNRGLRGIRLESEPSPEWRGAPSVILGDRDVGRLTSITWVPEGPPGSGVWMGLAMLRRDVPDGAAVRIGMIDATVTPLPLPVPRFDPA